METLCIDIGNTNTKAAVFSEQVMLEVFTFDTDQLDTKLEQLLSEYNIRHSILSSVGKQVEIIENKLREQTDFIKLSDRTKIPFKNGYLTPGTLGMDRVAAVSGAMFHFPQTNCLVIDAGTCITYDFITAGNDYLGGAISPGLDMRLKAMHQFTAKLPDLSFQEVNDFVGNSTETCMQSGVFYGISGEINETINRYEERYGPVQVVTCGGDSPLFDKHIKRNIFAAPFLVLYGLNKILTFNV